MDEICQLQAELDQLNQEILMATLMTNQQELVDAITQTDIIEQIEASENTQFQVDFGAQNTYKFDPKIHAEKSFQIAKSVRTFNHNPCQIAQKTKPIPPSRVHNMYKTIDQQTSPLISVYTEQSPSLNLSSTLKVPKQGLRSKPPPQQNDGLVQVLGKSLQW
ncbi:hypothetical protein SS50377_24741 [Spironucleus salmonicida]|uniref:Uncharacterized protein n=1 Tax=Spironucleus salmonicida TaxID=348837 RepID=V6LJ71_9EUKA|nr:hypothetical protein SS50377_24741 [Spironucleus salmonicida]|eukprot:EST44622.1 Hypothetical protein SS50377_15627 [Spironucleus salmonicida]